MLIRARQFRQRFSSQRRLRSFYKKGMIPWSIGYGTYRKNMLLRTLSDDKIICAFRNLNPLPAKFGYRIDERIVEYPWLFSRLGSESELILDAGGVLNYDYLIDHDLFKGKSVIFFTLSPERFFKRQGVSYLFGDLRNTPFKDEYFETVLCFSTLEHIGLDNTYLYDTDSRSNESDTQSWLEAVSEIKRIMKPGGKLLVTVPFGKYQRLRWLQQFDKKMIDELVECFGPSSCHMDFYKYENDGWNLADSDDCSGCGYYDVNSRSEPPDDYCAAARAVVLVELKK